MRLLYICAVTGILLGIGAVLVLGVRQSDETVRFCLERQRLTAVLVRAVRPQLNVDTLIVTFRLY